MIYQKTNSELDDLWKEQYEVQQGYCRLMWQVGANAAPLMFCLFMNMLVQVLNVYFIGNTGDAVLMAGVGLGSMLVNVCALAPTFGLNAALQSLISQANGASQKPDCDPEERLRLRAQCGVIFHRSRVVCTLALVVCSVFFLYSDTVLISIGENKEVSKIAR